MGNIIGSEEIVSSAHEDLVNRNISGIVEILNSKVNCMGHDNNDNQLSG